jgi:hypothetical protein
MRYAIFVGLALLVGCSDGDDGVGTPVIDSGVVDGSLDAGGEVDGSLDAGGEVDGSLDAEGSDAMEGDAMEGDSAIGAQCGAEVCDLSTQKCCVTSSSSTCIPQGDSCGGASLTCDGPEDCASTQECCLTGSTATCTAVTCSGVVLCQVAGDCTGSAKCCDNPAGAGKVCLNVPMCPGAT